MPFISICIPAYQRAQYLTRLLESVSIQQYADFEVIVTDDSPGDEVKQVCDQFERKMELRYYKNASSLGTPANWNEGIRLAKGAWIKLMHDDDWFADESALQNFSDAAIAVKSDFIFLAYINVFEKPRQEKVVFPELFRLKKALNEPAVLVAKNFIGPPSVTLHKNDGKYQYDTALKWLVDIDMYRRRMEEQGFFYIQKPLVKVGIGETQVTAYTKNVGKVEIPEHFHFLNKMGISKLKNVLVYDYNWRFLRNFDIKSMADIEQYGYSGEIHPVLQSMIKAQSALPVFLLKKGIFSKAFMFLHF